MNFIQSTKPPTPSPWKIAPTKYAKNTPQRWIAHKLFSKLAPSIFEKKNGKHPVDG